MAELPASNPPVASINSQFEYLVIMPAETRLTPDLLLNPTAVRARESRGGVARKLLGGTPPGHHLPSPHHPLARASPSRSEPASSAYVWFGLPLPASAD